MSSYLKDISVFVRVVELKGFAAAGRALGLSAPSISKQIARLEAELGVSLLHRTTHNLFLTDAGRAFYDRCVEGLAAIEEARAEALGFNDELKGKLRVHSTLAVGQALIAPAIADFMLANRQIEIDLDMSPEVINPMEHQVDLAIRVRASREASPGHISIGRRVLGQVRQCIVASPTYLAEAGTPETIDDVSQHRCLMYLTPSAPSEFWQFVRGGEDVSVKIAPVLHSNNWMAIREAAVRGVGLARLPDFTVRDDLESGRLTALFAGQVKSEQHVQAVFPKARRMPAKMRLLLDFLAARIGGARPAGQLQPGETTAAVKSAGKDEGERLRRRPTKRA